MIICDQYEGDNLDLARKQHDVYFEALGIIIRGCRAHYCSACTILGVRVWQSEWPEEQPIDHRIVQDAHDLLAAVWRHRVSPPDPMLLGGTTDAVPSAQKEWLKWLRCTVDQWNERPEIVRVFVRIFLEQNTDARLASERELTVLLRNRYQDIRWKRTLPESDYG